jgi:hypothetical protein
VTLSDSRALSGRSIPTDLCLQEHSITEGRIASTGTFPISAEPQVKPGLAAHDCVSRRHPKFVHCGRTLLRPVRPTSWGESGRSEDGQGVAGQGGRIDGTGRRTQDQVLNLMTVRSRCVSARPMGPVSKGRHRNGSCSDAHLHSAALRSPGCTHRFVPRPEQFPAAAAGARSPLSSMASRRLSHGKFQPTLTDGHVMRDNMLAVLVTPAEISEADTLGDG